jgi:hypothetical protein
MLHRTAGGQVVYYFVVGEILICQNLIKRAEKVKMS